MDRRDIPISGTQQAIIFELDEEESRKKIGTYEIQAELYQYRLKIFDSLREETSISLKKFRNIKFSQIKHSETWDEERFLFEVNLLDDSGESQDSSLKIIKIIDISSPFKMNSKQRKEFEQMKNPDIIMEADEEESVKENSKEEEKKELPKTKPKVNT